MLKAIIFQPISGHTSKVYHKNLRYGISRFFSVLNPLFQDKRYGKWLKFSDMQNRIVRARSLEDSGL